MHYNISEYEATIGLSFLPRNLSYSEESYLDSYSISSNFVYNERQMKRTQFDDEVENLKNLCKMDINHSDMHFPTGEDAGKGVPKVYDTQNRDEDSEFRRRKKYDDSDIAVEEGVFLNMSDELDSADSVNGKSECLEDLTCSFSSPDEDDLDKSDEGYEACFGEAMQKALEKMDISNHQNNIDVRRKSPPLNNSPPLKINIDICKDANSEVSAINATDNSCQNLSSNRSTGHQKSFLDSPLYEDNEFNFPRGELRKSSSLKASKTPPGTPHRKKMVRFADAMGLDLESVRHVLNTDAPPRIPASAIADLQSGIEKDRKEIGSHYLAACFQQPGAGENFLRTVLAQKLCLENAVITDLTVTGIIRVANIGFRKSVRIRYSTNGWASFHDIMASYVLKSCDGPTDRFSFSIVAPADFGVGSKLEFAISYAVGDVVFWDNNDGKNYVFECFAKTTPTDIRDSWMHFL